MMQIRQPVVLILDSGVGGLSIYFLMRKVLPQVHYIYFFDNEGFPYGNCSEDFIFYRVFSMIRVIWKLIRLDLVIVACNTASIVCLHRLRSIFCFPIFGVFPAVELAVNFTRNGVIGFLATYRTICHSYTLGLVRKFASQCVVLFLSTPEFVDLAELKVYERGIFNFSFSVLYEVLYPWLKLDYVPDTVILGCTHFSFLKDELSVIFPKGSCFVDSHSDVVWQSVRFLRQYFFVCQYSFFVFTKNQMYCSKYAVNLEKIKSFLFDFGFVSLDVLSI